MPFEILSEIQNIETIAKRHKIRVIKILNLHFGNASWVKKKGFTKVRLLSDNTIHNAEIHWYEAHGKGRVRFKIKQLFD